MKTRQDIKKVYDIIVIGGGAAGLMAAGQAAEKGASVLLLEKKKKTGLKLGITGKGRCNLTNVAPVREFLSRFGRNGRFLWQTFSKFFSEELILFLHSIEIKTHTERGGRVFPESEKAPLVARKLIRWARSKGVELQCNTSVKSLMINNDQITGVVADMPENREEIFSGSRVIVATGGASYPLTGSTGDGYKLAKAAGHTVTDIYPSLVPLETSEKIPEGLAGLLLKNIEVKLWINGKKHADAFGEMQFMEFGVSGPVILSLSKMAVEAMNDQKPVHLTIDLKPALSREKLDARLLRDLDRLGKSPFSMLLRGLLPGALQAYCLQQVGIAPQKTAGQVTANDRKRLLNWLKEVKFSVSGYRPIEEAIITAGGIHLKEIDPNTLQSRIITGLYFAGEILDLDADTGGYNLQAAFSTGWVAGNAAVSSLES